MKIAALLFCMGAVAGAEESPSAKVPRALHFYRVDLTLQESSDGKKLGAHSYSMVVTDRDSGSIRVGSNVPFSAAAGAVSLHDVGTNINCSVDEQDGVIWLRTAFEESEVTGGAQPLGPVTHKISFSTTSTTTSGKPATVGAAEDPVTKHRFQLDVTATRLK